MPECILPEGDGFLKREGNQIVSDPGGPGGYDGDPETIEQDATHRFVSDDDIAAWDSKAAGNHNHDADYAAINHNHDAAYSAINHNHNAAYSAINHNHDGAYSASNHNHAGVYAPVSHTQGYTSGGSAVTQITSKATGVTINALCGRVTMHNAALAAAAEVSFVVTNNQVAATDVIIVNIQSVGTVGAYFVTVSAVGNGSFTISLGNCSAGSLSQALVLNFAVIKSVIA